MALSAGPLSPPFTQAATLGMSSSSGLARHNGGVGKVHLRLGHM
jgi:hypothetical protein